MTPLLAEPIRIALVGCGDIATTGHLPALRRSSDTLLVGVVDVDEEHRERAARAYGVPSWPSLDEAAEHNLDAVVIAVPPHVAPGLTMHAIELGLDVLCEKPMAVDMASAERVRDAAKGSDKVVQIGFKNRFSPLVEAVHRWLREGRIGSPVVYTIGGFDERFDPSDTIHTGRIRAFLEHGPSFVHEGAHLADYVAYLSDSVPVWVQAAGVRSSDEYASENFVSALVRYDNGDVARMEVGWMFPSSPRGEFRVLGPAGSGDCRPRRSGGDAHFAGGRRRPGDRGSRARSAVERRVLRPPTGPLRRLCADAEPAGHIC